MLAGPVRGFGAIDVSVQFSVCSTSSSVTSFVNSIGAFTITEPLEACSPQISNAVSSGTPLDVTVTFTQPTFSYQWVFTKIRLSSIIFNSGSGSDPTETISWASTEGKLVFLEGKARIQHVHHVTHLEGGDSKIDMTNTGEGEAGQKSGTDATITGALCANVYAFTPDEQMVACCSCPITPDGLVSLSARDDLISNTLTPSAPSSLTVAVVPTVPVAGTCTNSAAATATETPAPGLLAWGTNLHATPAPTSFAVTETPFAQATLSDAALTRLGNLCSFILANGSGFGVCRSCRLGGLGAVNK